ncbi:lipase/acylhydrolase [Paenibacillus sp. J31TS4]|uniref:GDSL-type esterase/lipase family protein n=1 Tax=Paenibacillus sp. J31TS4 TaxID=2807195 RepID=UPI001B037EFD|nr:GDSL-type esterase/lipase family protein [Paenibacillus sp. J31TS4]GIP37399.1 lipase/acylhydrolase [Paenibacillus sp. J31TS4]
MTSTRLLWRIAGLAALLSTLLFVFGFAYAVRDILYPQAAGPGQAEEAAPVDHTKEPDKLQIVAIGDSLTKGLGDTTGEGYVGKVKRGLEKTLDKPVFLWNYGVNGIRTNELLQYVTDPKSEIPQSLRKADIILITIGGNDLFQFSQTQKPGDATQPALNFNNVRKQMPEAQERLGKIFAAVAELNPKASIVYLGLYHPFLDYDPAREGSRLLGQWNAKAYELANRHPNITVVPTYDLFEKQLNQYLYSDHFHPNAEGYERMAQRVLQALQ